MGLDYYSFDNVLKELNMDEDELKRLVSEGQIRAFRDENRMKFRRDDIDSLKRGKQTEPTIILPDGALDAPETGGSDELFVVESGREETLLDLEGLDSDIATDESSVPSLDFDEDFGGGAETLTEELVFDEGEDFGDATEDMTMDDDDFDDLGSEATQRIDDDAFIDDDELGMQTEPLNIHVDDEEDFDDADATVVDDDFTAAGDMDEEEEEEDEDEDFDDGEATMVSPPKAARKPAGRPAAKPAASARPKAAPAPEPAAAAAPVSKPVGILWVIFLFLAFGMYTVAGLTMYDYTTYSFTGVSGMVGEQAATNFLEQKWQASDYKPEAAERTPDWLNEKDVQDSSIGANPNSGTGGGLEGN